MDPALWSLISNFDFELAQLSAGSPTSFLASFLQARNVSSPTVSSIPTPNGVLTVVSAAKTPNNGFALIKYPDQSLYVGSIQNGVREGAGVRTYPGGVPLLYSGEYSNGKKHGRGTLISTQSQAVLYEGDWREDKKEGKGRLVYDKGTYTGSFVGDWFHGGGVLSWRNGDHYEGEFVKGQRTGEGFIRFANGDSYEGAFLNGVFHGKGLYKWATGESFSGTFQGGQLVGTGTIKYGVDVKEANMNGGNTSTLNSKGEDSTGISRLS